MIKKASSKTGRKRPVRKEFLIPVHVVSQRAEEASPKEKREISEVPNSEKNYPKIVEDENNLPVFEREAAESGKKEEEGEIPEDEAAEIIREERKAALESRKLPETGGGKESGKFGAWSPAKKKAVMWASVAAVTVIIFFIWLSTIGRNLSLDFGSNSYTYLRNSVSNQGLGESFENLQNQWNEFGEYLENQPTSGSGEQAVEKLKEKVLIEEMKNKIEK